MAERKIIYCPAEDIKKEEGLGINFLQSTALLIYKLLLFITRYTAENNVYNIITRT